MHFCLKSHTIEYINETNNKLQYKVAVTAEEKTKALSLPFSYTNEIINSWHDLQQRQRSTRNVLSF